MRFASYPEPFPSFVFPLQRPDSIYRIFEFRQFPWWHCKRTCWLLNTDNSDGPLWQGKTITPYNPDFIAGISREIHLHQSHFFQVFSYKPSMYAKDYPDCSFLGYGPDFPRFPNLFPDSDIFLSFFCKSNINVGLFSSTWLIIVSRVVLLQSHHCILWYPVPFH